MNYQFEIVSIWPKGKRKIDKTLIKVRVNFSPNPNEQNAEIIKSNILTTFLDEKYKSKATIVGLLKKINEVIDNEQEEFSFGSETSSILVNNSFFYTQTVYEKYENIEPIKSGNSQELLELLEDYLEFIIYLDKEEAI